MGSGVIGNTDPQVWKMLGIDKHDKDKESENKEQDNEKKERLNKRINTDTKQNSKLSKRANDEEWLKRD